MFQTTNQMGVVNIPVVTACLRFLEGVLFSRFECYNMFFLTTHCRVRGEIHIILIP